MKKIVCWVVLLVPVILLGATGCALRHVESHPDAARYAGLWDLPRLEQQPVQIELAVENDESVEPMLELATDILLESGKFRLATPEEPPAYHLELRMVVREKPRRWRQVAGGLFLYLVPVGVRSYRVEAIVNIETPEGELVGHSYLQGRGEYTAWLGHVFGQGWRRNDERARAIQADALKALTVQICRALKQEESE